MVEQDEELVKKARLLADATGRSFDDVLEDLLDDGKLNNSNIEKADLVSQLKEAAELITTVQSISQEVSKNSVLNGGENKTEVKVETTLEGDIVDRAIASAQRKADNIKKLAATLIPIFLLITGGSMEAFGVIDIWDSSEDDYDPYYDEYGGCLAPDAENYDPLASWDDGSCWWDDGGNGGGGNCEPDWWWKNEAIFDHDHNGQGFNNDLRVQVDFRDLNGCNEHMNNGYFEIMVGDDSRVLEYNFHDEFNINEHYLDLPAGDYYVTVDYYTYDGSHWNGPEAWVTMESEPNDPCAGVSVTQKESFIEKWDNHSFRYYSIMIHDGPADCVLKTEYMLSYYHNNTYQGTVESDQIGWWDIYNYETEHEISEPQFDNLGKGDWNVESRWILEGQPEECCIMTNRISVVD